MPLNFEQDLLDMLNTDEFATVAVIQSKETSAEITVKGLLDGALETHTSGRVDLEDKDLQFHVPTSQLVNVVEHDFITIDSIKYQISAVQPDMTGMTVIEMYYAEPDD